MTTQDTLVGIVGLGSIGGAVAEHVLASRRPMIGWARRPESLKSFAGHGGRAAASLAELAPAEVVISVVFDDAASYHLNRRLNHKPKVASDSRPGGTPRTDTGSVKPPAQDRFPPSFPIRETETDGYPATAAHPRLTADCQSAQPRGHWAYLERLGGVL